MYRHLVFILNMIRVQDLFWLAVCNMCIQGVPENSVPLYTLDTLYMYKHRFDDSGLSITSL